MNAQRYIILINLMQVYVLERKFLILLDITKHSIKLNSESLGI